MFPVKWLDYLDASHADIMIFIIGMLFAAYVIHRDKQRNEELRELWRENKELREENKTLSYRYHQVDKLTYGIAIAIQKKTGIKLVKQSANSEGDDSLNRDVS